MIMSMTGFGRGIAFSPNYKLSVDLKSLNSKQLDLMMRVPPSFKELELDSRSKISSSLERGKIDMNVSCEFIGSEAPLKINVQVLKAYKQQLCELSEKLEIPLPEDWYSTLLRLPDSMKQDNTGIDEADIKAFYEALNLAIDSLKDFRIKEGKKLYDFLVEKVENISRLLESITDYEKERVPKIRQKLEDQLVRLSTIEFDSGRLEQEMIFYIEKLDVTEEKTRLKSHLNYFLETMGSPDLNNISQGQGKKLGFIAQEMGREINTLGSKSNHSEMQKIVVMMKDELEQIKEQVLNVL